MAFGQVAHQQVGQQAGIQAARAQHDQVGFENGADGAGKGRGIVGLQIDALDGALALA